MLEVNKDALYAIIEPGVSLGILSRELGRLSDLRAAFPDPPHSASVLANYVNMGMVESHSKYGVGQELILGLEVVLPTGEVIKTGSWTYPQIGPHSRYFGPDLTGLFLSSFGTLGVITKAVIKLFPKPEVVKAKLIGYEDLKSPIKDVGRLLRQEIADRIFGHNWVLSYKAREVMPKEMEELIGKKSIPLELVRKWKEKTGLPEVFYWVLLEGDPRIVEVKEKMFDEIVSRENCMEIDEYREALPGEEEDLINLAMGKPSTVYPQLYMGVKSSYAVMSLHHVLEAWPKIYDGWMNIGCSYGFPLQAGIKPYQHGRWAMTKFVVSHFHSESQEDCEKVTSLLRDLLDYGLEDVHQPSSPQGCVLPHVFIKCSHYMLYKQIKSILDPNGIMHPSLGGW